MSANQRRAEGKSGSLERLETSPNKTTVNCQNDHVKVLIDHALHTVSNYSALSHDRRYANDGRWVLYRSDETGDRFPYRACSIRLIFCRDFGEIKQIVGYRLRSLVKFGALLYSFSVDNSY
jgi:hypothetical protein